MKNIKFITIAIIITIAGTGWSVHSADGAGTAETDCIFLNKNNYLPNNQFLFLEKDLEISTTNENISTVTDPLEISSALETDEVSIENSRLRRKRTFFSETSLAVPKDLTCTIVSIYSVFIGWDYLGGGVQSFGIQLEKKNKNEEIVATDNIHVFDNTWYIDERDFEPNHTYTYKVRACLDWNSCSSWSDPISVTFVNYEPILLDIADYEIDEAQEISIYFMGVDAETIACNLRYTVSASNPYLYPQKNITINRRDYDCATLALNLVPVDHMSGSSFISITVYDLHGASSNQNFSVTVNPLPNAPILSNFYNYTIAEDTSISIPFFLTDHDQYSSVDDEIITYTDKSTIIAEYSALTMVAKNDFFITGYNATNVQIITTPGKTSSLTLSVSPKPNAFGKTDIYISATDSYDLKDSEHFILKVYPVNDPPEIETIENQATIEDIPLIISTISLRDIDSKSLTITALVEKPNIVSPSGIVFCADGMIQNDNIFTISSEIEGISIATDMDIHITPLVNAFGDTDITICVDDGDLQTTTSFALHITEVNDSPFLVGIHDLITNEDTSVALSFQISDTEGSNRGEFIITTISSQTDILDVTGIEYTGTHVTPANEYFSVSVAEGTLENITLILHPKQDMYGTVQSITISVTDSTYNSSESFALTVVSVNDEPAFSGLPEYSYIYEDTSLSIPLKITDIDRESSLTVTVWYSNPTLVNMNNIFLTDESPIDCSPPWTITMNEAINKNITLEIFPVLNMPWKDIDRSLISVNIADTYSSKTQSFLLNVLAVDDAPTITQILPQTINEDTINHPVSFTVADNDGSSVTITVDSSNPELLPESNITFNRKLQSIPLQAIGIPFPLTAFFSPTPDLYGSTTVSLTVTDATGLYQKSMFTIDVQAVNQPPEFSNIQYKTLMGTWSDIPDTWILLEESNVPQITFTVSDVDGGDLTLTYAPTNCILPKSAISFGDGKTLTTLSLIPGQSETLSLAITLPEDVIGFTGISLLALGDNGLSTTQQISIEIDNDNDPPKISATVLAYTIAENSPSLSIPFSVSDVDGDQLYLEAHSGDTNIIAFSQNQNDNFSPVAYPRPEQKGEYDEYCITKYSTVHINCIVKPEKNQYGEVPLTVTVKDRSPEVNPDDNLYITVNINGAPDFSIPESLTLSENNEIGCTVAQLIVSDPESDNCTISIIESSSPNTFSIGPAQQIDRPNKFNIIANEKTNYEAIQQYTICILVEDAYNQSYTTVVIDIIDMNDPPTISPIDDLLGTTASSFIIPFTITDLETDPNNLDLRVSSSNEAFIPQNNIQINGVGSTRTLVIQSIYQLGSSLIEIIVTDTDGASIHENFLISSNMPPTVPDKEVALNEDTLFNILLKGNDPEKEPLSYTFVDLPTHGNIEIVGDIATYTPNPDYFGMDRFTYKANDSYFDSNIADVVLTIINTPDPPVAKSFTIQTDENVPYTITFQKFDVDGDPLTCHIVSQPQHGNISDSFPSLVYTPDDWYWGADRFVYKLSDGSSESLTAIVTIEINQATDYPLILETNDNYGLIIVNGTSVLCPYTKTFAANDRVTVEAISTDDHIFDGWSVNHQISMENPITITMTTCQIITVHFVPPKITVKFFGHESIKINDQTYSLPFENSYYKGNSLIIDALPHNRFIKWIGDITETQTPIEINCQSDITIGVIFANPFEWKASLIAETTDLPQTYTDHIQIGVSISPQNEPYLFTDIYACRFISYGSDWQQYHKNIQIYDTNEFKWILSLNPHGNMGTPEPRTSIIRWNPDHFSELGKYQIQSGYDQGKIVVSDMRTITEYPVTGGDSVNYYTVIWSPEQLESIHISTNEGWNLVSIPLIPDDNHLEYLFPDAVVAYEYTNGTYVHVHQLEPGKGYWVKLYGANYVITGESITALSKHFTRGWHLVGTLEQQNYEYLSDCISSVFKFDNGAYVSIDQLIPGYGYWIYVVEDCDIEF